MITGKLFAAGADRRIAITITILLAIAIIVPVLNLAVPQDSALHIPPYAVALFGKYLCYAMLALALDLQQSLTLTIFAFTRACVRPSRTGSAGRAH